MSTHSSQLEALLDSLKSLGGSSSNSAYSMPPEVFTSRELLALERERIFRREWICVGRDDELAAAGDYFTTEIDRVPIIVVRNEQGELKALANVCRHRMARIAEGAGKTRLFTCPYHAWSYDFDGNLANAPGLEHDSFDRDSCSLPRLRLEVYLGFIYINLDENAAPLTPRMSTFTDLVRNYHVEQMRTVWKKSITWKTNWKVLIENFLETYHIPVVHRDTLLPYGSLDLFKAIDPDDAYSFYLQGQEKNAEGFDEVVSPDVLIDNPDLGEFERFNTAVGCVFPSHLMSISWFGVLWLSLQPVSPGELRADWGAIGPVRGLPVNAESYEEYGFPNFIDIVNNEDKPRVEAVQLGAESGYAASGPLHATHERTLLGFISYLSRQLCDDAGK